ncbi:O-antigen ligase family protein [Endozoicomonas elysicola]|uniref:O-antigen ligase-related domain-containing protein n=1 Tax=Endozoicomonas elysicola TaxID=305900 RepID=A0A081K9C8_9GAMM|nr:O-antigen ligase family protein [Endozoicomonas elysicola]KEI70754.1 hypothetical protein GV64_08365 [Endozoicomonas elysicola]
MDELQILFISCMFLYWSIVNPTYAVIIYLLFSTKVLGFYDLGDLIIGGLDIGYFTLHMILMVSIILTGAYRRLPSKLTGLYLVAILLLFYGLIYPVALGYQSFTYSIIGSKDYLSIILLFYMAANVDTIDRDLVFKFLCGVAIYFSFVYVVFALFTIAPTKYLVIYESGTIAARTYFPTYISLAIFYLLSKGNLKQTKITIAFTIMIIGLIFSNYTSITLTTLAFAYFSLLFKSGKYSKGAHLFITLLLLITLICLVELLHPNFSSQLWTKISEVLRQEDLSQRTRTIYNEFRWEAINKNPLWGYGFLHPSSYVMDSFVGRVQGSYLMNSLAVIDSGYVDLLTKFGFFGTGIYLICIVYYVGLLVKQKDTRVMGFFLVQFFLVNYTWSVLSYRHGIIPMSIVLALFLFTHSGKKIKRV